MFKNLFQTLRALPKLGLIIGAAILLLGTALALWWALSPRESLLFGNLREADAAEISASLDEWKIPYRFTPDGSGILVDEAQMHAVRMRLVSAGVPKGGHVGFELFNDSEFGVTEFAQRINYQRALQGEIERTIATIPGVLNARVHLSIRRPGLFLADDAESKASVSMTMEPGAQLDRKQVAGIRNLVAAAVEGLKPQAVVVLGPGGESLAAPSQADASSAAQDGDAGELSTALEAKVRRVLESALPGEAVSVSVNVRLNFDRVHRTSERLLTPAGQDRGVLIRRNSSGERAAQEGAPPPLLNEQVEYAHGSEREEVTRAVGTVERISVAVLLPVALPAAEQEQLRRLAWAAAGLEAARGDALELMVAPAKVELSATPSDETAVAATSGSANPRGSSWNGWTALMIAVAWLFGLLLGAVAMSSRRRAPPALTFEERDQVAQNVRAWLAGDVK
jgi:flagellar M-ring protein FliF